ncbi:MAG: DUF1449 family protein [Zoogloeaceae bacterium]|jgi:hypothetical protein|nr:DUF1449 family protein [Zoogloeaceae bacterium]
MTLPEILLGYPTVLFVVLLGVVLLYWCLAIAGLVDFEGEVDLDIDLDADASNDLLDAPAGGDEGGGVSVSGLAGMLVALGLSGVPFSVVVSLVVFFGWFLSTLASLWLLPLVPTAILKFVVATGILLGSAALSVIPAAACVRPLRRMFVKTRALSSVALVGRECVIETGRVDEHFGRAVVTGEDGEFHLQVVAETPNPLTRGAAAVIVDYDAGRRVYRVAARAA